LSGLNADLTILKSPDLLLLTGGLVVIASIGKFAGAFVGGTLGRLSQREALALACAMNARGSTEVIVATVGLSMGVLSQNLYTMIVTMAVVTTVAMPPMLRWALMRIPIEDEERIRLEREELDARGFVPNLERLLLAADDSANGRFASRLADLIAGSEKKPITVLDLSDDGPSKELDRADEQHEEADSAADAVAAPEAAATEEKRDKANVTTRPKQAQPHEAVAREALKGYGLLVVGIENTRSPDGGFTPDITRITVGFQGAIAVVAGRGPHVARALEPGAKILVPANGTEAARRAAEIALVMAKSTRTSITALYVASGSGTESKRKRPRRGFATRRNEEAILKEVVELADRYDIQVRTALRVDVAAEDAILREARRGAYDLIVLGVTRRPGDTLFFGNMAAAILESAYVSSVLFVAT
jgi:nucleotide-binding universal stress UspA family protein